MFAMLSGSFLDSQIITDIGTLVTQVWTWITANAGLTVFFTLGLIGSGIGLFKSLKGAARH